MKKKKVKSSVPRHKRLVRSARLQAAKHWIPKYEGKNILRGYKQHFGVNWECAIIELEMLGVTLNPQYIHQLRQSETARLQSMQAKKRKQLEQANDNFLEADDTFYFIAGYTENGFPFGITWLEADQLKR